MDQLMDDTIAQINNRIANNQEGITGIPTGLEALDRLTCGWQKGDLDVIAARPAVGKTAFALHLAIAAARAGKHVVIYSLEMQGERLADRWLLATSPDVSARHLRGGQLLPDELAGVKTEPRSKYPTEGLGMVMVAKHRNGETGDIYFAHNASMTKIGEYTPPTEWLMKNAK